MKNRYFFSASTLLLITILSLVPAREFPQVDARFADKWAHWVMYAAATLVIGIEQGLRKPVRRWHIRIMRIAVFTSLWGALMEVCQATLTTTRSGDAMDAAANTFGAACGATLLFFLYRQLPRLRDTP